MRKKAAQEVEEIDETPVEEDGDGFSPMEDLGDELEI